MSRTKRQRQTVLGGWVKYQKHKTVWREKPEDAIITQLYQNTYPHHVDSLFFSHGCISTHTQMSAFFYIQCLEQQMYFKQAAHKLVSKEGLEFSIITLFFSPHNNAQRTLL